MKVGLSLPNLGKVASKAAIDSLAKIAEEYYDSVWAVDHLLIPKEYGATYGRALESLVTLSYLASKTEKVMLGTGVIVFPMREVVLLAKQAAAIQILSQDRLLLGFGSGWNEIEFNNVRADYSSRGQYYDEGLQLFRWFIKGNAEFTGEFYKIDDGVFGPIPDKEIPIYIGGNGGQSIRRTSKLGDGWFPIGASPSMIRDGRKTLRRLSKRRMTILNRLTVVFSESRSKRPMQTTVTDYLGVAYTRLAGTSSQILEQIAQYKKGGLDCLVCYFGDREKKILELKARKFAKEIIPSI